MAKTRSHIDYEGAFTRFDSCGPGQRLSAPTSVEPPVSKRAGQEIHKQGLVDIALSCSFLPELEALSRVEQKQAAGWVPAWFQLGDSKVLGQASRLFSKYRLSDHTGDRKGGKGQGWLDALLGHLGA